MSHHEKDRRIEQQSREIAQLKAAIEFYKGEPRLVSYCPEMRTCTLNFEGNEYYYDLVGRRNVMADGMGCKCFASSEYECCCEGVDWTTTENIADKVTIEHLRADLTEAGKWKEAVTASCMQVEGCLTPDPVQTMKALCDYWFSSGMAEQQTVMETDLILKLRENVDFWADDSSQKSLELDALRAENAALKKDGLSMRTALLRWCQRTWPNTDQAAVIDQEFPAFAKREKQNDSAS